MFVGPSRLGGSCCRNMAFSMGQRDLPLFYLWSFGLAYIHPEITVYFQFLLLTKDTVFIYYWCYFSPINLPLVTEFIFVFLKSEFLSCTSTSTQQVHI